MHGDCVWAIAFNDSDHFDPYAFHRWITFIDAAYESASRLLILAAAKPDDLFFPEARQDRRRPRSGSRTASQRATAEPDDVVDMSARGARSPFLTPAPGESYPDEDDAKKSAHHTADDVDNWVPDELTSEQLIQSETLSEARQDVEEGFRPNIASYVELDSSSSPTSSSIEAKRRAENGARRRENEKRRAHEEAVVGFPDLAIFSGADERFSYARAVSRLHEMASPMWRRRKRWTPLLEQELRLWGVDGEQGGGSTTTKTTTTTTHTHADGSKTERSTRTSTTAPSSLSSREAHPTLERMGDFADEASYEASTFPSRTSYYSHDTGGTSSPLDTSKSGPIAYNMPSVARARPHESSKYEGERAATGRADAEDAEDHRNSGPPKISPVHIWGQAEWGPRAGKWGKGPTGKETDQEGEQETEELRVRRARMRRQRESERGR